MYLVTETGLLIGKCVKGEKGWRFMPMNCARKPSRKEWPTANACIPKWAFDMSDDLLTADEWEKKRKPR